jgi:hypothetical protein
VPAGEPSGVKFAGRSIVVAVRQVNWPCVLTVDVYYEGYDVWLVVGQLG